MVNWILVEIENDNFLDLVFGFWVFQKIFFFCFIIMKISQSFLSSKDGTKF